MAQLTEVGKIESVCWFINEVPCTIDQSVVPGCCALSITGISGATVITPWTSFHAYCLSLEQISQFLPAEP